MKPIKTASILVSLGLVAFLIYQFVSNKAQSLTAGSRESVIYQHSSPPSDSEVARRGLEEILSGKRTIPSYENYEANSRYYKFKEKWISDLTLADCVALIESVEKEKRFHQLLDDLYERYGELDHEGAFNRLNQDSKKDGHLRRAQISYVLIGWGRVEPAEAWDYFLHLDKETVFHGYTHSGIARSVFKAWAKNDPSQAFQFLIKAEGGYFHAGLAGYYWGLTDKADFPKEAEQLEEIMKDSSYLDGSSWTQYGKEWTSKETLPATFVSNWANHDTDAAIAWWLKIDDLKKDDASEASDQDYRAFRMGVLFVIWSGPFIELYPDKALQWANANLDILQNSYFIKFAIPSLAKHRPVETIELIRKIHNSETQAQEFANLTRAPVFMGEGKYRSKEVSEILSPDLVESVLDSFSFNEAERQKVVEAIRGRREYEANKPAPPPSDW